MSSVLNQLQEYTFTYQKTLPHTLLLFAFKIVESLHFRSSRLEVFCRKGVLRNFAKFTGKHLCQSLRIPFFYRTPPVAASGNLSLKQLPPNCVKSHYRFQILKI